MSRRVLTYTTVLALSLLWGMIAGATPGVAQSAYTYKAIGGLGGSLNDNGPLCYQRYTPPITAFMAALQYTFRDVGNRARRGPAFPAALFDRLAVRGTLILNLDDWPWPDDDALFQAAAGSLLSGGESWSFTAELVRPFPVGARLEIEPFLGAGGLWRNEYRPEDVAVTSYEASANLLLTFGASVGVTLTDRLQIHGQVRRSTLFLGTETFVPPNNISFSTDIGSVSLVEFLGGVAYRFGRRG